MDSKRKQIRDKAVEFLKSNPDGLRYAELHRLLIKEFPEFPLNTIQGSSWDLHHTRSDFVYKPTRGLFKYKFEGDILKEDVFEIEKSKKSKSYKEEDFYEPFADWIKNELGECTEAVALGGNAFGKKWGTPDVLGIYKPSKRDVIKFEPELITAEIKIDWHDPITAFGQSIAYRLFSTKVYLVEPKNISSEDLDRIESLCMLFGVGLILFELNPKTPNFEIRVRAHRFSPDMFYVNEFAHRLFETNEDVFNELF